MNLKNNNIVLCSISVTVLSYVTYLIFRGFGWDGDTILSAAQSYTLVGSDLYGALKGGSHPKLLSIIIFGTIYRLTGGFYILTIISMLINTTMVAVLVFWINKEKGSYLITLIGLLVNIPWTKIVINCDNPAFSIPFIIFGLYYTNKNKFIIGAFFLILSNLFRSGSEFVLFALLINQVYSRNYKNSYILGSALIISLVHSFWGYFLVYQSKDIFWSYTWGSLRSQKYIEEYQYSIHSFILYFRNILQLIFNKYNILFAFLGFIGIINTIKKKISIKILELTPLETLVSPIGAFIYGAHHGCYETKLMSFSIMLIIFSSYSIKKDIVKSYGRLTKQIIFSVVLGITILLNGFAGYLKKGDYEAHTNGSGRIGWVTLNDISDQVRLWNLSKLKILTHSRYLAFTILDLGEYASSIEDITSSEQLKYDNINQYDLIILPNDWNVNIQLLTNFGYSYQLNSNYIYFYKTYKNY